MFDCGLVGDVHRASLVVTCDVTVRLETYPWFASGQHSFGSVPPCSPAIVDTFELLIGWLIYGLLTSN